MAAGMKDYAGQLVQTNDASALIYVIDSLAGCSCPGRCRCNWGQQESFGKAEPLLHLCRVAVVIEPPRSARSQTHEIAGTNGADAGGKMAQVGVPLR